MQHPMPRWIAGTLLLLALAGFSMQPFSRIPIPWGSDVAAAEPLDRTLDSVPDFVPDSVLGAKLARRLAAWSADRPAEAAHRVQVSVGPIPGLTAGVASGTHEAAYRSTGRALVDLDLARGVVVAVSGSSELEGAEVWLIDNRPGPGRNASPEPGDGFLRVGRLVSRPDGVSLRRTLDPGSLRGFEIDLVAVVPRGGDLERGEAWFGFPSLADRLRVQRISRSDLPARSLLPLGGGDWLRNVAPGGVAGAAEAPLELAELVALGETLFTEETFAGNGRTCATCHPPENDFTLDPEFIARRPDDDPLFISEQDPVLADLEHPQLLRRLGLIRVNADGFEDPANRFVLRSVPHLLALNTSLNAAFVLDPENNPGVASDGTTVPPLQRAGWSGDGAPGNGTLLEFALGAVVQHATRSLDRVPDVDFRVPTMEELEALEAFQLTIGRESDPLLQLLRMRDPFVERGRRIFQNAGLEPDLPQGKCIQCHSNAGARVFIFQPPIFGFFNRNSDIGTERMFGAPARAIDPDLPFDGGFGTEERCDLDGDGFPDPGVFGNCSFNTPTVVEAADTGPFFHNHAVATLEEAIAFYNSEAFNDTMDAQSIRGIDIEPDDVAAIAAFLRALNVLENVRSALELAERALATLDPFEARRLLGLALADTEDGIRVLSEGRLHPEVALRLEEAARNLRSGAEGRLAPWRTVDLARPILLETKDRIQAAP